MDLQAFQSAAERTMTNVTSPTERMLNAALGLCGEAAEIAIAHEEGHSAHVLEETGDFLWYMAQMCKAGGISIAEFDPPIAYGAEAPVLTELWYTTGKLADSRKKEIFHHKEVSGIECWGLQYRAFSAAVALLSLNGHTLSDACEHNVAKLLKRFPDGFSHAAANARRDEVSHGA